MRSQFLRLICLVLELVCVPGTISGTLYIIARARVCTYVLVPGTRVPTAAVVVVVLTLARIIKSVVTGQAPVTLELRNAPGKTHKQIKGGTRTYHS